jgi:Cu/Ag efflux protein CusF
MNTKLLKHLFASTVITIASFQAFAQAAAPMDMPMDSKSTQASSVTEGEVRKVDLASQKVTLKHGDIKNLGMPGMTMAFKVAEPKMLNGLKEGEKVMFTVERVNGSVTVTSIEAAK